MFVRCAFPLYSHRMTENPTRVEAFSDGVFAIAITLLILEIRVLHVDHGLWAGLVARRAVAADGRLARQRLAVDPLDSPGLPLGRRDLMTPLVHSCA